MPLLISRNDITKITVDAIVNAANTQLRMGGGVCGAIFKAAGEQKLQQACNQLAPIKTGEAVITDGFKSKAKFIIHTAGPIYKDGDTQQEKQLYNCYQNSLKLAAAKQLESVAFPLISSGIYGYPPDKALNIALKSIHDFLGSYDGSMTVYMIVYNNDAFAAAQKLYADIESYIDERLIKDDILERRRRFNFEVGNANCCMEMPSPMQTNDETADSEDASICECCASIQEPLGAAKESNLGNILSNLEDSFNKQLFKFIRQKNMTNAEVYKNANLDRRLFSKIISNEDYTPGKNTIFALAISLKLNIEETQSLLRSAGFAISHSSKADLIIEYYITHQDSEIYNIDELNFLLFKNNQVQLGQV